MSPENFVYWLRGYLEIAQPKKVKKPQIDIINQHLDLVLTPVTRGMKHFNIPQFSQVLNDLKDVSPAAQKLSDEKARDEALASVQQWYPPPPSNVFPRLFDGERVYGSC